MSRYDREYYFLLNPMEREDLPSLTPDENTARRRFRFKPQPPASAPLMFFNGAGDYQRKLGVEVVKVPPRVLFDGANPVVDDAIRDILRRQAIPYLHIHPAVYIHDDGAWYENYWYLAFSKQFDCRDRTTSSCFPDPVECPDEDAYEVIDYHLNDAMLDAVPLDRRRLFEMGGTNAGTFVCHESLVELFGPDGESGVRIVRVDDYGRL